MADEKTIEQRKTEYKFHRLIGKLRDLSGEDGTVVCGISSDDVNKVFVKGSSRQAFVICLCLLQNIGDYDESDSPADIAADFLETIRFMMKEGLIDVYKE